MQHFKMRSASAVFVIATVLLTYGACGESPTNGKEGACEVVDTTAVCGEVFTWPENDNLTKIVVRSTLMTQLGKSDLEKYPNLETLDVSNSGLTKIDSDALTANLNLEELNLSGNKDLDIPDASTFISSNSLTHLNLSYINVPETIVLDLPKLQVLDLTSTSITTFSSLSSLENLTTLIISENSTQLDNTEICNETHLRQIIEVDNENDKRTTFKCPGETSETIPSTTVTTVENEKQKNYEIENTTKTGEDTEISKDKTNVTLESPQVTPPVINETSNEPKPKNPENSTEVSKTPEDSTEVSKTPENSTNAETEIPEAPEEESTKPTEIPSESESPARDENPTKDKTPTDEEMPEETEETKPDAEKTAPGEVDNAPLDNLIRFAIPVPPKPKDGDDSQNTHEDIKEQDTADVKAVMPQPPPAESNGVNIVLGIILTVMIVGALGFGYKYYKKRRSGYRNANTEDVEDGKELQNMVSHRDRDRATTEQLTEQN